MSVSIPQASPRRLLVDQPAKVFRIGLTIVTLLLLATLAAEAQEPQQSQGPKTASLFPQQAPISVPQGADGDRLVAVVLPPEVLSECRRDLSDLRVVDASGAEVPYLVDGGFGARTARFAVRTQAAKLLGVEREQRAREGLAPRSEVSYSLAPPRAPVPEGGPWELVVEAQESSFVLRGRLELQGLGSTPVFQEASLFRLQRPLREQLRLPASGAESAEELVLTVWGEGESYPELSFRWEQRQEKADPAKGRLKLELVDRTRDGSRTIIEYRRPPGLVPDALVVTTTTGSFARPIEVWDQGPEAGLQPLARQTLFRLPSVNDEDKLEISLAPARAHQLRIVIDDGDSPALKNLQFEAVVRRPALIFPWSSGQQLQLLFGGGRADRPRYDLAALPLSVDPAQLAAASAEDGAEVGAQGKGWVALKKGVYGEAEIVVASLGDIASNPDFDATPLLAYAQRAGAPLAAKAFQWRRAVSFQPSPEGLNRLVLEPLDLAGSRPDLGDLRLRNAAGEQWPYLLVPQVEESLLGINPQRLDDAPAGTTRLDLPHPVAPAPVDRVEIEVFTEYFDRVYRLQGREPEGEWRTLLSGRIQRQAGDPRPLVLDLPGSPRLEELVLEVEDGDDAPLETSRGMLALPVPALYFAAPEGELALLYGAPKVEAPSYDLQRARSVLLGVPAGAAKAGELESNPEYSSMSQLFAGDGLQRLLLYGGLGLAVLVLGGLTLRLVRGGEENVG
ncbi:MAG: hypothetical protein AAGD01_14470 [Acidobacteriota bacterium]